MELTQIRHKWIVPVLGAAIALMLFSGVAFAEEHETGEGNNENENGEEIVDDEEQNDEPVEQGQRRGIVGEVIEEVVSGEPIVVRTATGEDFTIDRSRAHEMKYPGEQSATGVGGSLEQHAQVAVLVEVTEDGTLYAVQILVKPQRPTAPPFSGAVVERSDGQITIMHRNGTTKVIQLPSGAGAPELGELVTAFATDSDDANQGPPVARGLVRAEEVRNRLMSFIASASPSDDEGAENGDPVDQEEQIDDLTELLDDYTARHLEVLEELMAREDMPEAAMRGLQTARENAARGRETALQQAQEAQERAAQARERRGPPNDGPPGAQGGGGPQGGGPPPNAGQGGRP